ncbi:MAG: hypothetical protein IJR13_00045 [Bacteroidales bacterium]|nr:hypothetical protein [Bacteroidales bacterium]
MKKLSIFVILAVAAFLTPTVNAQTRDWGCTPEVQQEMLATVSLYQADIKEYKNSKDVRYLFDAYPKWKMIVANCPKQSKNLYINGVNILKAFINDAKTDSVRNIYIEELMTMYDTRIANYGEAAEVLGKKAMDLWQLRGAAAIEEVYNIYSEAIKQGDKDLDAAYVVKYMESTINYVRAGKAEPTLVVDNYDIASDLLDKELESVAGDSVKTKLIAGYIAGLENAFSPYAGCEELVNIYSKKFEQDPDNIDLLKKITGILMKKGCTTEPLFFSATEKLYSLEPSPATALRMGQMSFSKEQYGKAISYLSDAVKGLTETKDIYKAHILIGLSHTKQNAYSAARAAFLDAAKADPTKGEPYVQIANLYASSARMVDDNMNGRSVYWAAVDKLNKAKSVDQSEENIELVNKLISSYAAHYPKKADVFMAQNLSDGQSFLVGGWIGESTIVRTR